MIEVRPVERAWTKVIGTAAGLAMFVVSLTVLFLSMRAVLDIGGTCASGGPYVVANQCPKGAAWLTPVSIWVGLGSLYVYWMYGRTLPGPHWVGFAWPALFLSLGWNFFEYGLDDDNGGTAIGLLICGVLFLVMGAVPLWFVMSTPELRHWSFWGDGDVAPATATEAAFPTMRERVQRRMPVPQDRVQTTEPTRSQVDTAVVDALERLAAMRRSGDIDQAEFEQAKQRLLDPR